MDSPIDEAILLIESVLSQSSKELGWNKPRLEVASHALSCLPVPHWWQWRERIYFLGLKQTVSDLESCAKYYESMVAKCSESIRLILMGRFGEPILFLRSIEKIKAIEYLRIPYWIRQEGSKDVALLHETVIRLEKLAKSAQTRVMQQ